MPYLDENKNLVIDTSWVEVGYLRMGTPITITLLDGQVYIYYNDWNVQEYLDTPGDSVTFVNGQNWLSMDNYTDGGTSVVNIVYGTGEEPDEEVGIYSQPSIVPAAISSELDNHGEERIHIAPYVDEDTPQDAPSVDCMSLTTVNFGGGGSSTLYGFSSPYPSWWGSQDTSFEIDWFDDNTWHTYIPGESEDVWELLWGDSVYGVSGRGTLRQSDGTDGGYYYICLDYDIPPGA